MRGDNFVSVGKCCQFQDVANVEQGRISINSRTVGSNGSNAKKVKKTVSQNDRHSNPGSYGNPTSWREFIVQPIKNISHFLFMNYMLAGIEFSSDFG